MNDTLRQISTGSVTAISASGNSHAPIRAVKLKKRADGFELLWKMAAVEAGAGAEDMFEEIAGTATSSGANVVCFDSTPVAFYRVEIPPVEDSQAGPIVEMQLQSLLPVLPEQMQTAWHVHSVRDGKRVVSVAAARADRLGGAVATAKRVSASQIILNSQAVVKAWSELFDMTGAKTLLIHIRPLSTQLLLAEDGKMSNCITLDSDLTDLSNEDDFVVNAELFVHDLRGCLSHIGLDDDLEICLLSPDGQCCEKFVSYLQAAGLNVKVSAPRPELLQSYTEMTAEDICDYIEVIGAAMLAAESEGNEIDLFKGIYCAPGSEKQIEKFVSLKFVSLLAIVSLVVCLFIFKALDQAELNKLKSGNMTELIKREDTRKAVAQQRTDVLGILTKISDSRPDGMLLDSFSFKNNTMTISSHASSFEQIHEFQKNLRSKSGFTEVKDQNPVRDEKSGKVAFKMVIKCKTAAKR